MDFCCPVCGLPLVPDDKLTKRCAAGHSFDRARQGYYNLLVGAGAGVHGDNREMVEARRAFLSAGHYAPLAERVSKMALGCLPKGGTLLDLGAGEGYYTDVLERSLTERDGCSNVLAFDISKDAIKHLARLNPRVSAAVASSYAVPLPSESVDLAVAIFAPLAREEIHRLLKTDGCFIMVFPDELHLYGLKSALYKTPYKNKPEPTELEGFALVSDVEVAYTLTLEQPEDIKNLFMMTPYAYRTPKEGKERLLSRKSLTTEVAFRVLLYKKA